jgi:hypothetical protein
MKLAQLFENHEAKNLIGQQINGRDIILDKTWHGTFNGELLKLTSLQGAPAVVDGYCYVSQNYLTSLEYAPAIIKGSFHCSWNSLTSLKDVHKIFKQINGTFFAHRNPIKSHVLGLLLIKGLESAYFENEMLDEILGRHLPNKIGNKGVLACQSELLDAGLDDFAQL